MAKPPQTRPGDVLILTTDQSFRTFAVGRVVSHDQLDFHEPSDVQHVDGRASALKLAKVLIAPGGKVFLRDLDTEIWSEIPMS